MMREAGVNFKFAADICDWSHDCDVYLHDVILPSYTPHRGIRVTLPVTGLGILFVNPIFVAMLIV